ncbi:somatostatin receptor type 2-like [Carassius auratus]|uniref:Somatostatin receptor type 2-like n=1 Tax=Carassius auratus TaxID=7957 RepID=A0A6P6M1V5_CARAU|nr:somatostatin receptor type 2-like [Carassius auratus]
MNNSIVNFSSEASTNSITHSFWLVNRLDIFLYSINLLFGFPLHAYVIWLIITGTSGVASGFFSLNLSVSEIGNCLNSLVCIVDSCLWIPQLKTLTWFLLGLGIAGRPLFQCLICVERYLAVVHPVTFLKYKPLRYRVICSAGAWMITLGSCLCCMFTVILQTIIFLWFYSIQFVLLLFIQLICLVTVLWALKQSGPGERGRERKEENHMKRRAFCLILITTVTMIFTYVPFTISGFSVIHTQQFIKELFSFGFICYVLAGFVQPILYLHRSGKLFCFCSP